MTQRTAVYGLPWVEPTDVVNTYPTVSEELATDVESGLLGISTSDAAVFTPAANVVRSGAVAVRYLNGLIHIRISLAVNLSIPAGLGSVTLGEVAPTLEPYYPLAVLLRTNSAPYPFFVGSIAGTQLSTRWSPASSAATTGLQYYLDWLYRAQVMP